MSDRIIVMRDGVIEQDGSPREIYEEPKNLFVARFIGEINVFNATMLERIDVLWSFVTCITPFGCFSGGIRVRLLDTSFC